LSAASRLAEAGQNVIVLEKEPTIGGSSKTIFRKGFGFDFGPHNFHTTYPEIKELVREIVGEDFKKIKVNSKIFYREKWVNYPLKGIDVFTSINPLLALACAIDFLKTRAILWVKGKSEENSFEEWITKRFGKKLYKIYFEPYASKVWGINPRHLSKDCAEKRVPVLSLFELALSVFFGKKRFHPEDPAAIKSYYPKKGVIQICEGFRRKLLKKGGRIYFNVEKIFPKTKNRKIGSINFVSNGKAFSEKCDFLVSTMPLNELLLLFAAELKNDVESLSKKLKFRSEVLLFLAANKASVFGSSWVYFSGTRIPFNRVTEFTYFSRELAPKGKTGLCVEFTCNENDSIWKKTDKELLQECITVFEKHGFLKKEEIEFYFTKKLPNAYPIYDLEYKKNLKKSIECLLEIKNLATIGRLGLFCYANMDEAIKMGTDIADLKIKQKPLNSETYKEMFPKFVIY